MASMWLTMICGCVLYFGRQIDGARILGLFPSNGASDFAMYRTVLQALADKGHKVEVVGHFPLAKPYANYTDIIDLSKILPPPYINKTIDDVIYAIDGSIRNFVNTMGNEVCDLLGDPALQRLIKEPPKDPPYDIVLTEFFLANCYLAFGRLLDVPVVGLSAKQILPLASDALGNPSSTAYVPAFGDGSIDNANFWQRFKNTMRTSYVNFMLGYYTRAQTNIVRTYIDPSMPDIRQIERDVALLLVNSHHSFTGVRPMTPAVVEVGGLHVVDTQTVLQKDVKKWLDESKEGCIYINFGPDVRIETFPEKTLKQLWAAINQMKPVRFLMRADAIKQLPPGLTGNVMTFVKLPHGIVLQHPNVKAFMTLGNLMDVQEAISYGVPLIGLPIFGDHFANIKNCIDKGIAVSLNYEDLTADDCFAALNAVVKEKKYKTASLEASKVFRDRPLNPGDAAVYWIQYIIKNGKNVLRSPAMELTWWQLALVDVYGNLVVAILLIIFLIKVVATAIIRRMTRRPAVLPTCAKKEV